MNGPPRTIPMSSPDVDEADVRAVAEVVRSGRHALGPKCLEFEERLADYVGAAHAVAVSSGTAALHLILLGLELGPGDEVIVPSFTFAASVNAVLYVGATPVFAEIEPDTFNLDPADVARRITPRTKAVLVVDVFGHPAEWDALRDVCRTHDLLLIDDSCEALGAEYRGAKLGTLAAASSFAFYPNKQISTGEGGMVVTDDAALASSVRSLRNQGRAAMGAWLEHERLGFNYRMDEMSAALGASQLRRIESFLKRRARVAREYGKRLACLPMVRPPAVRPHVRMSWFVYVATLAEGLERRPVIDALAERGVPARGYFSPIHLQPYMRDRGEALRAELPLTESVARRTIALPFHNRLTDSEIDYVVDALTRAIESTHVA